MDSSGNPVGLVKGPAETQHEFKFVSPDKFKLKTGEYVYYHVDGRKIICRIIKRQPLRLYPDVYLSRPNVPPERIIRALGITTKELELFEIKATIIGYYDKRLGFVNPRIPPSPGQPVYLAEKEIIQEVLMKRRLGECGSMHIGYLLNRDENIPVILDTALVASEHMCILAATGSGKSYLAGVMAEELLKPYNRAALLILDPHGEYYTLKEVEKLEEFKADSYSPKVKILTKDEIKIRLCELEYDELVNILPRLTEKMEAYLNKVYRELEGKKYTVDDLVEKIRSINDVTARALTWRVKRYIKSIGVISDYEHLELNELLRPGQASILQLTEMSDLEQQVVVSVLLKRILNARINAEKGLDGERLNYPVFIIIEEAHRFASKESKSYQVLKTILSEGRKFGVGVCLISQRPSKINPDILSQCMTQVIMRIINPADQENIRSSVETIGKDLIEELPGFTKGQALVAGVAVNSPILIRVRERLTSHGGSSKNAPVEWIKWKEEKIPIIKSEHKVLFWNEG